MPTDSMIQWMVGQTGLGAVAVFALWMLRESYKVTKEERNILITTLQNNIQAMTALTAILERNTDAMERCKLAQAARKE